MHEFSGFRIERELGRGAMAVVYLATQLSLKRAVALKVLDRQVDGYAGLAQRFINEAHTLAGLRHRNIVNVYDVVESAQADFISMEYLDGGSLSDRLRIGLTVQESLAILAQLGSALDVAHASGVVHRDIKPDNVLFRDAVTPVLADFGIARELAADSHMTQDGLVLGTPSYMAPEQISGEAIDGRADQYSLGAMWFQMLTGRVPYEADSTTNLLYAHMARPIPPLPEALAVLQPVLNRMLAKKPDERYPDMAAMLLDVSRHLLHAPELLRTPPGTVQVSPTERLHQLGFLTTGLHAVLPTGSTQVLPSTRSSGAHKPAIVPRPGKALRFVAVAGVVLALGLLAFALRPSLLSLTSPASTTAGAPSATENSIAVLPFVNMSADKDQDFFADGISEELLNQLAKIPDLRVIARTSSFAFKGKETSVSDIATKLNVAYILEGSVRKSGNKLRITAQLIRTADSSHIWSETYDREITDIFAVQDEISEAVVDQLKLRLLGGLPKVKAINPEAYGLFLHGRQSVRARSTEGYAQAQAAFEKVLVLEPDYATAWLELGNVYQLQASAGMRPIAEGFRMARGAVNKALAIDPDLAFGHAQLGGIAMTYDGDMEAAAEHFTRALSLGPKDIDVLRVTALFASNIGQLDGAIALAQPLEAQDPANPAVQAILSVAYANAERHDEAIATSRKALLLAPDSLIFHYNIGIALMLKGELKAALAEMQQEPARGGWGEIGLPMIWHALGDKVKSDTTLATLIATQEKESAFNIAYVHAYRGDADLAFEWLEKAVVYQDPGLSELAVKPLFANIHKDPRWLPFLRKLGRAPEQLAAINFAVTPAQLSTAP